MPTLPDKSIDMILCDLPYGITACKWDSIIPFEPLWAEYKRLIKDNGAIVLTASQPFTSILICSNLEMFKYEWIWEKNCPTGNLTAKYQPMKNHENIIVFGCGKTTYNRQMVSTKIKDRKLGRSNGKHSIQPPRPINGVVYTNTSNPDNILQEKVNPRTVLHFDIVPHSKGTLHPTQKPVALFEYLIKTYTNEGEVVLDNCAGSGTTAIACLNTNRNYIVIEKEKEYIDIINKRIAEHEQQLVIL